MRDVQVRKMKDFHTTWPTSVVGFRRALLLESLDGRDHFLQLPDAGVIDANRPMLVQGHRVLGLLRYAHKVSLLPRPAMGKSSGERPDKKFELEVGSRWDARSSVRDSS